MKLHKLLLSIFFISSSFVIADVDITAGKDSYAMCAGCHGASGEGITAMNAPALTGQSAEYIARQLSNFKSGLRGGDANDMYGSQMKGMAAILADDGVENIAAYIASLPITTVSNKQEGDLHKGTSAYQGKCGACHGGKAQGNTLMKVPALTNLDSAYIVRQIANYKAGLRGTHAEDTLGKQMKMMANVVTSDEELNNIITYIHSVPAS